MGCKKIAKYGCLAFIVLISVFVIIILYASYNTTPDDFVIDSVSVQRIEIENEETDSCKVYKIDFFVSPHSFSSAFLKDVRYYLNGCADSLEGYSLETSSRQKIDALFEMYDSIPHEKFILFNDSLYISCVQDFSFDDINDALKSWCLTSYSYVVKLHNVEEEPSELVLNFSGRELRCRINNDVVNFKVDKRVYVNPNGITEESLR